MRTIGQKIEECMKQINITQKELANRTNVTEATISRYLSGIRSPRGEILSKIATVLGVTTDYLLGNEPNNNFLDILNFEEEKDIEKILNKTIAFLENQDGLTLLGKLIDTQDFKIIKMAIQNGLEYAKISSKK